MPKKSTAAKPNIPTNQILLACPVLNESTHFAYRTNDGKLHLCRIRTLPKTPGHGVVVIVYEDAGACIEVDMSVVASVESDK